MAVWHLKRYCHATRTRTSRRSERRPRPLTIAIPLATLPSPLEHGALGAWDEVAVGVLLVGCALAYAVWFYLSGRKEKPHDSD